MKKTAFYRLALVVLSLVAAACASLGSGGQAPDGEDISARGAVGRLAAVSSGPMFAGDGGKDIRLAILAPEAQGAAPRIPAGVCAGYVEQQLQKVR